MRAWRSVAAHSCDVHYALPRPTPSSNFVFQQIWIGADVFRQHASFSSTPYPDGPPANYPITGQDQLQNYATRTAWYWYTLDGKETCTKSAIPASDAPPAFCVGAGLTLNGTFTFGARTVYRWVGRMTDTYVKPGSYASVTIGSVESTDPAQWLEITEQGTYESSGDSFARSTQLSGFSDAPIDPSIFDVPPFCEK